MEKRELNGLNQQELRFKSKQMDFANKKVVIQCESSEYHGDITLTTRWCPSLFLGMVVYNAFIEPSGLWLQVYPANPFFWLILQDGDLEE